MTGPGLFAFDRGGYRHVLLARAGEWGVVERTWIGDGQPHLPHFEIVRFRSAPPRTWPDGHTTPAHERYPTPSEWGRTAWSEPTLVHAAQRWERIRELHPELPTWIALGIADDPEGHEAWKEGRMPRRTAPGANSGISEGGP